MTHIEQTNRRWHGGVLFDNAGVLHRHVPTAKIDHLGFGGNVCFEERRTLRSLVSAMLRESKFQGSIGRMLSSPQAMKERSRPAAYLEFFGSSSSGKTA